MKTNTKAARAARFYETFRQLGFTFDEIETLRRAEMTLHRWAERECNGEVERDESTGKTYAVSRYGYGATVTRYRVADRETGALRRIAEAVTARNQRAEIENFPIQRKPLGYYHQTDPRGCALYILRPGDVPEGEDVRAYYSRGLAVCI